MCTVCEIFCDFLHCTEFCSINVWVSQIFLYRFGFLLHLSTVFSPQYNRGYLRNSYHWCYGYSSLSDCLLLWIYYLPVDMYLDVMGIPVSLTVCYYEYIIYLLTCILMLWVFQSLWLSKCCRKWCSHCLP